MLDSIMSVMIETVYFFNEIAIYLVFGFLVAGILHILFPDSFITKHFGKSNKYSVLKASLFGIPLPICSCGIIPVSTSMKKKGASDGAVISFLISTPQIGADSFMITYSLIGWIFGIFRILSAFISAVFAGLILNLFSKDEKKKENKTVEIEQLKSDFKSRLSEILPYIQFEIFGSIAKHLVYGILVAAAISIFIPESFFSQYLNNNFLSMLIMLVVGIPMYICATSSTPIAASLILKGISPGAALVFLLVGPATNALTISAVAKTMGKKAVVIYLATISVASVMMGYIMNFIAFELNISIMHHAEHEMLPTWLKIGGSIILAIMFIVHFFSYLKDKFSNQSTTEAAKSIVSLDIEGMTCQYCVASVRKTLQTIEGVSDVEISLQNKNISFKNDNAKIDEIKERIRDAGFQV